MLQLMKYNTSSKVTQRNLSSAKWKAAILISSLCSKVRVENEWQIHI
jgi:hypothetical protein